MHFFCVSIISFFLFCLLISLCLHSLLFSLSSLITLFSSHFLLHLLTSLQPFFCSQSSSFHAPPSLPSVSISCQFICCLLFSLFLLSSLLSLLYPLFSTPSSCLILNSFVLAFSLLYFCFNFPSFLLPSCSFMTPSTSVFSPHSLLYPHPAPFSSTLPLFCPPTTFLLSFFSLSFPSISSHTCTTCCSLFYALSNYAAYQRRSYLPLIFSSSLPLCTLPLLQSFSSLSQLSSLFISTCQHKTLACLLLLPLRNLIAYLLCLLIASQAGSAV